MIGQIQHKLTYGPHPALRDLVLDALVAMSAQKALSVVAVVLKIANAVELFVAANDESPPAAVLKKLSDPKFNRRFPAASMSRHTPGPDSNDAFYDELLN